MLSSQYWHLCLTSTHVFNRDPLMSGTFQALQSYRFEDIIFDGDARYTPCLQVEGDHLVMDLNLFHEVEQPSASIRDKVGAHDAQLVDEHPLSPIR